MEEEDRVIEKDVTVVSDKNVTGKNPINVQNESGEQQEHNDDIEEQHNDLHGAGMSDVHNVSDVDMARTDEIIADVTGKSECVEVKESESMDKADWIVRRISELGNYENVNDSVKADIFGFDIADVSGSIRLFSDVMKRLVIKLDGTELYEEFQRIYDESVSRDTDKEKSEDKMWNRGRGR